MTGKKGKKTRRREWGGRPSRENGFRSLLSDNDGGGSPGLFSPDLFLIFVISLPGNG